MSHLPMEQTHVFLRFSGVADQRWEIIQAWKGFPKSTIGSQLIRSLDIICANLVEGDGRYSDGEAIHFFTIARASARESKYWISVSSRRGLISESLSAELVESLNHGMQMLNKLIEYRRRTKNQGSVKEATAQYNHDSGGHIEYSEVASKDT